MFKKIILSLLVIYALVGFVIVPIVLKSKVVEIANQNINAKISIDDIDFNPFIFRLGIYGLELNDLEGKHLVSLAKFEINVDPYRLYDGTININEVFLDKPQISLIHLHDKTFNLASIVKKSDENKTKETNQESSVLPHIVVDKFALKHGAISFEDYTKATKFDTTLKNISFTLKDIDTDDFTSSGATFKLHTVLGDGGELDIRTNILGLKPLHVDGSIDFKASKLYTQYKYMRDMFGIEVADGKLSLFAKYKANLNDLDATTIDNIKVRLTNLRIKPKDENQDVLNLQQLALNDVTIKPFKQEVYVDNILLNSLHVEARRYKNGELDWAKWFTPKTTVNKDMKEEVSNDENTTSKPWNVRVNTVSLNNIGVGFDDKTVSPSVKTTLNELNIKLSDITLAGEKPFLYDIDLVLNDKMKCLIKGDLKHKDLELNTALNCKDFDITHYNPYIIQAASKELKENDISLKNASLDIAINAKIKEKDIHLKNATIAVNKLVVNKTSLNKNFLTLKKLEVRSSNLLVDMKNKTSDIKLKKLNVNLKKLNFYDYSISELQNHKVDYISLSAKNINSKKNTWLNYNTKIKLNTGGLIVSSGKVQHTPLAQKGDLSISKLSLKEITPYLQEGMFIDLKDGYVSLKSKLSYAKSDKQPDLHVEGSFDLDSLNVADSRTDETLLSINSTNLNSFNLKLFPSSIYIDKVDLDSFYVDAVIDENKVMNFAKLAKAKEINATNIQEKKLEDNTTKKDPFNYKVMTISVKNGTSNFADYSLPIPFKTSMHTLNGNIYSISNDKDEITMIDIDGEVDKYGSNKIKGSLKSADFKSFTDIAVRFKNLSLDSYSGYSAQFAGHKIKEGKLFLDLEYKIKDSQLLGKNNLMIKKIELGEEIEDENITKLPLGFAIALLEDGDGIIDIDMPVEGNMDEPDFKYGALLLKTFANLIVKVVASPFKFLGAAMGIDGEELEFADFEPGSSIVLAPEREKMDNVAKILNKKPKLSFEIIGTYDAKLDKYAMQKAKAKAKVLALNTKKEEATLILVEAVETIYVQSMGKEALQKLQEEMKKKLSDETKYENEYKEILFAKTIELESVSQDELDNLAKSRAKALKEYLMNTKAIDTKRIIVDKIIPTQEENDTFVKTELKIIVK